MSENLAEAWDGLLDEFRAVGGIAENVRLAEGAYGRGVFPVDPERPIRILIPQASTIAVADTMLRDGELVVRPGAARKKDTRFFDNYQRHFGWSAGGREFSLALQGAWHELPADVVDFLKATCALEDIERRFVAPTDESALQDYARSRVFLLGGRQRFVPLIDMVNHRATADGYLVSDLVGVEGTFDGEVFVSYNKLFDAISVALSWGFADQAAIANCLAVNGELENGLEFTIARAINQSREVGGLALPNVEIGKKHFKLSFLTLGNLTDPLAPRATFRELMRPLMEEAEADQVFDTIVSYNQEQLLHLLSLARKYDQPLARMLANAALNQLKVLGVNPDC
jgi:hypothetical protein